MKATLQTLVPALLAAFAIGTAVAASASATTEGHFVVDSPGGGVLVGTQGELHVIELSSHGLDGGIVCDKAKYEGIVSPTTTSISLTPTLEACRTTSAEPGTVSFTANGCTYVFTPMGFFAGTIHLSCPAGKSIEVHHPSCTIRIPSQSLSLAVVYEPELDLETNVLYFTARLKAPPLNTQYEGGICIFLGTNHTGTLSGSFTLKAYDPVTGEPVDLTQT